MIILFSPTALNESNAIFKNLKPKNIYLKYDDEILKDIDEVNEYQIIK